MPTAYRIGPATRAHVRAIPAIEQAAATLFSEADLPPDVRYRVTGQAELHAALREGHLWTATAPDDTPVGFAMVTMVDGDAHLDEVDVLPAHCRLGIGTRLVQNVIRWAEEEEFQYLTLVTFTHLPWNAPFYRKLDFVPLNIDDIGPEMRDLLSQEAAAGLDISKRQVMSRTLG